MAIDTSRAQGSLADQVADWLRQAIIAGEFELGQALSEDRLSARLGVSRSPVRHALGTLQQEGLINVLPQRGSFVFLPSAVDLTQLCEFRCLVEAEALRLSCARAPAATLAALTTATEAMQAAGRSGDHMANVLADGAFHAALVDHSGNPYLQDAYRLVAAKIAALRAHRSSLPTRSQANEEHFEIIRLITAGDIPRAAQALSRHILKMVERYRLEEPPAELAASGTGRKRAAEIAERRRAAEVRPARPETAAPPPCPAPPVRRS